MTLNFQTSTHLPALGQTSLPSQPPHTPRTLHVMHFFDGVILALAMIAALLFLRYYRRTRDRMFLFFAAAFMLFGINRIFFQLHASAPDESKLWLYAIRLASFCLIIAGLLDKNVRSRRPAKAPS